MRLLIPVAIIVAASGPALAAKPAAAPKPVLQGSDCAAASSQWVRQGRGWQSKPQKLGELPPADSYAAVYRLDERGCMVPVKFREIRP
jgi:hypothetical protein